MVNVNDPMDAVREKLNLSGVKNDTKWKKLDVSILPYALSLSLSDAQFPASSGSADCPAEFVTTKSFCIF
jgi:hypothetical protein